MRFQICPICEEKFSRLSDRIAYVLTCCGNTICSICWTKLEKHKRKCPFDRRTLKFSRTVVNRAVMSEIDETEDEMIKQEKKEEEKLALIKEKMEEEQKESRKKFHLVYCNSIIPPSSAFSFNFPQDGDSKLLFSSNSIPHYNPNDQTGGNLKFQVNLIHSCDRFRLCSEHCVIPKFAITYFNRRYQVKNTNYLAFAPISTEHILSKEET